MKPQERMQIDVAAIDRKSLSSQVFAYGFSFRKRSIVRRFVGDAVTVHFIRNTQHLLAGDTLLLWGSRALPQGTKQGINVVRMEDGFLRSVGLGAELVHPLSWVIDHRGIYYDATRPSDLEHLLQNTEFSSELLQRAAVLRSRIVASELTKYNVGTHVWQRPALAQQVILVPGQVENDASIRFGAPGIASNLVLLKTVRAAYPEAYIVYKPHPDVVAGLRRKGKKESEAQRWCNEIVTDVSMGQLLSVVDEVHVLTSLAGFEALLRGKKVVCYGQPFYAGWGLTQDKLRFVRRTRHLSLDALVAGALILYPTYISREPGMQSSTAERALDELLSWRVGVKEKIPWWRKIMRSVLGGMYRVMGR